MTLLCKVQDAFDISGRGCVIVPVFPEDLDFKIRAKDKIQLHTPDGRLLDTHIAAIEFLYGEKEGGKKGCQMAIMLPRDVVMQDVPTGIEVWLL